MLWPATIRSSRRQFHAVISACARVRLCAKVAISGDTYHTEYETHDGEVHDLAVDSLVRRRCIDCKVSYAGASAAPASTDHFMNARKHCTTYRRACRNGLRNHTRVLAEAIQPGRNLLACDLTFQAKKNTEQFDRDFRLATLQDVTQPVEKSLYGVLKDGDTALLVDGYSEIQTRPIQTTG